MLLKFGPCVLYAATAVLSVSLSGCGTDAYEEQFQKALHPPPPVEKPVEKKAAVKKPSTAAKPAPPVEKPAENPAPVESPAAAPAGDEAGKGKAAEQPQAEAKANEPAKTE